MKRLLTQCITFLITNINLKGFFEGKIYKGVSKYICVPGLNCYSCPGAVGSCPIGALQAVIGSVKYQISFYIIGILMLFGTLLGRFICGWLCPFGLVQDILYKIPSKKLKLPKFLGGIKYVVLVYFVITIPLVFVNVLGMGSPGFCKYICPSGTLLGALPLLAANEGLRQSIGFLFEWKMLVLIFVILASVFSYRFFCKVLCPLGIIYGLFNKISFYQFEIDKRACTNCNACKHVCKMDVNPSIEPNSRCCIRCGDCLEICPQKALTKKKGR